MRSRRRPTRNIEGLQVINITEDIRQLCNRTETLGGRDQPHLAPRYTVRNPGFPSGPTSRMLPLHLLCVPPYTESGGGGATWSH